MCVQEVLSILYRVYSMKVGQDFLGIHYVNGNKLLTGIDGDASEGNPLGVTGYVDEVSTLPLLHGWQELS